DGRVGADRPGDAPEARAARLAPAARLRLLLALPPGLGFGLLRPRLGLRAGLRLGLGLGGLWRRRGPGGGWGAGRWGRPHLGRRPGLGLTEHAFHRLLHGQDDRLAFIYPAVERSVFARRN